MRSSDVDIVHFDIEVKTDLRPFWLGHPLKSEPRCRTGARPKRRPTYVIAMLIRRLESEQLAPKT